MSFSFRTGIRIREQGCDRGPVLAYPQDIAHECAGCYANNLPSQAARLLDRQINAVEHLVQQCFRIRFDTFFRQDGELVRLATFDSWNRISMPVKEQCPGVGSANIECKNIWGVCSAMLRLKR